MDMEISGKRLAIVGGRPLFQKIRSISNLVRPDIDTFLAYAGSSFQIHPACDDSPLINKLETRLCEIHQVDHCVSFCNGLWGIVLTMQKLVLPNRSEVVMPTMTYRRLADIAAWVGLTPRFCDIDRSVLGPTPETVEPCINDNTALLLIAQPIVNVCDMEGFSELAQKHHVPLIFDSVEAAYASFRGKMLGSFGDAECYSMHASKLLNAFEAGYVTTSDGKLAESLRCVRNFGLNDAGRVVELGLNAKLHEIHAAMALAAVDDLPEQIKRNRARYLLYKEKLKEVSGLDLVEYDEVEVRGFKNIMVEINDAWPFSRDDTIDIMHAENMLVRPYYYPPLHTKKTQYATIKGKLPVAEALTKRYMLLPSGEFVSHADIIKVVSFLGYLQENGRKLVGASKRKRNE